MISKRKPNLRSNPSIEICILAGGLSQRMGRDKSRLRLGRTTMLGQIRKTARTTGFPVRVIRRDCVPKCGPLGGIYTALKTTKADAVLFLACDMPLVTTELVQFVAHQASEACRSRRDKARHAFFTRSRRGAGFPFILVRNLFETVARQIDKRDVSLHSLARTLRARMLRLTKTWSLQLFNVNTPKDWALLKAKISLPQPPSA